MELNELVSRDATLEKLASGLRFTEGPVWMPQDGGYLIFSDIPADTMYRWSHKDGMGEFRKPSHNANGNITDRQGRLITCEHSSRRVTITGADGGVKVLIDRYDGKRFNSPNDVVVKSDGSIWFTDPTYGLPKDQAKELPGNFVFRFDPETGLLEPVVRDCDMPNGLCFSPDEKRLYVADSGKPRQLRVWDVLDDKTLKGGTVFCQIDVGAPDGIRCDEHGNVWSTAGDGVQIFASDGKLLGRIPVPESPSNLCFGGDNNKTLFITARTSVYSIAAKVLGATRPR